jgi:hypothetical protein
LPQAHSGANNHPPTPQHTNPSTPHQKQPKNKIGPLSLFTISIINRVISDPIFIGGAHGIFITWTAILVIFAYLDYRKLSKQKITQVA